MRKLVSHLLITLDGVAVFTPDVIEAIVRLRDDEVEADFFAELAAEDAMLLGRATYAEWAAYWPTSDIEPFASHINRVPKYVASTTLEAAPWNAGDDAIVLKGALAEAVTALKQSSGENIGVHGSPTLVESLLRDNLLDELRLEIYPVIAGAGPRFFQGVGEFTTMELIRSKISKRGVAILTYRPMFSTK